MKKLQLLGILILSVFLTACSSSDNKNETTESTGPVYVDNDFLAVLGAGLDERWEYVTDETNSDDEKESLTKATNLELDKVDGMQNGLYEDSKLQEYAISYINELKHGLEVLDTYGADSFIDSWQKHYDSRTKLLVALTENYTIPVKEEHQSTLDELSAYGQEVSINEVFNEEFETLLKNAVFEYVPTDYDATYKKYAATIENTTSKDIESFSATVNLLDSEDVIVDTQYLGSQVWGQGQKMLFEFSSDKEFATTEVSISFVTTK